MAEKRKLSDVEDECLISFIEVHPELFNANHANYKNIIRKEHLWIEIAKSLERDGRFYTKIIMK